MEVLGLGSVTDRHGCLLSLVGSGTQPLQVLGHAVREHREVRNQVRVGDDVEVQLAGVGQRPDLHGDVASDDADLEQLEDLGAGEGCGGRGGCS